MRRLQRLIILDTDVVSELMRPSPRSDVAEWVDRQLVENVYLTAITVTELVYGVARMPAGQRQNDLTAVVERLVTGRFRDRVFPFDVDAAREHGHLVAARERAGRPMPGNDSQIAGICLARGLPLATRNTKDFEATGVELINPWEGN